MPRVALKPIGSAGFPGGYKYDPRNRLPSEMCSPSANVRLTRGFSAITRAGYTDTGWNLNQSGKSGMPLYIPRFNVSLIGIAAKIYYIDHNADDAICDVGLTLTTGTVTRFEEAAGQVLATNKTDGQRLIVFTKLNDAAATAGDATVTVDIDGSARIDRFDTALSGVGALRIKGTSEPYTSLVATTGVITLTGTLSQTYADDTVATVVYDISSGRPKASKLVYWKEYLHAINVSEADASATSDVPPAVVHFTDVVTAATIEKLIAWTGGTSGRELVGKSGVLQNAVPTNNNLYLFKEDKTFRIAVSDVNATTGARPPQLFLNNEGCANEDSAVNMGSDIVFATRSRRILRILYADQLATSTQQLDTSFDDDVLPLLAQLDEQYWTGCHMHYDTGERILYFQAQFGGTYLTLCYENRPIYDDEGNMISKGRWLPPDTNKIFKAYFNINSDLYATDFADDTIFKINDGTKDNETDMPCVIAFGKNELKGGKVTCMWKEIEVTGGMTSNTTVTFEPMVGDDDANTKDLTVSGSSEDSEEVGTVVIADITISGGGTGAEMIDFAERLAIYPSLGSSFQPIFSSLGDGHAFRIDSYKIEATAYPKSTLTMK